LAHAKNPVLVVDGVSVALPTGSDRALAFESVSFAIAAEQTLCVVGESGSGKSVLAMALMGLLAKQLRVVAGSAQLRLDAGSVDLLGASAQIMRAHRGQSIGMVFQEPMTALNPVMRCGDQLDEVLQRHTSWDKSRREQTILDMMQTVRLPEVKRIYASYPHQLSGGQRQRIVIAMAMLLKPRLLICDEPTTALDVTTQREVLKLIKQLQQQHGSAVLFITHDMSVVGEIADQVLVMNQGTAVEYGPKDQVLHSPKNAYTKMLLASVPSLTPPPERPRPQTTVAALKGVQVSKTYTTRSLLGNARHTAALQQASIDVLPGETLGVVGESGCGKSTLARCLIRLIDPSDGQIFWGDAEVAHKAERDIRQLRNRVQVVFQDPNRSLNPRQKVGEAIAEGAINLGKPRSDALALAKALLHKVAMPPESFDRYPSQFSGGQRQRIAIARALACEPLALIADEAVSALDVSVQAQVMRLLKQIQNEMNLALLFITHDLRVAAQLCDRLVVMQAGQIVEQGLTAKLFESPQHPYTQRLLAAAPQGI
jgi:peptide/nickel transport system ATP-binding protein